ncbi:MAG: lytic transglycosylase domain-containing protein [Novosphingobium sp.]
MSSTVRSHLLCSAVICLLTAGPAASQSVSIPVVQPIPSNSVSSSGSIVTTVGKGSEWDQARDQLRTSGSTGMAQAVSRWQTLVNYNNLSFGDYSSFLITYPSFPQQDKLRKSAEDALSRSGTSSSQVVAYFDKVDPLSNPARAQYALALSALGRPEAKAVALAAWRGGDMTETAEATIGYMISGMVTPTDQDARMNALLWSGDTKQAERQIGLVSPQSRAVFMVRLAALQGSDPAALGLAIPTEAATDPGWLYNRAVQLTRAGRAANAASLLAYRGTLSRLPLDREKWVTALLSAARRTDSATAYKIAAGIDDAFAPDEDISAMSYRLRDDYTSLMWLGGTKAMQNLGRPRDAAPLFWRYGNAARTPQTRSKGFYWAGRALAQAGDETAAKAYFEQAAAYPDQFYGQLALERLGQPLPEFSKLASVKPTKQERQEFLSRPIVGAVREVARDADWRVSIRFFREIASQASTPAQHQIVAELARDLGRRDLGVILGQAAGAEGIQDFEHVAFPLIPTPLGTDWTMVHAISRQESQFAQNAISHAGARGLMQLMPGTAREQAGKIGLSYQPSALIDDPGYNIRLGDGYFGRMMSYYNGSYPLAVAAYNAGPGNVNKWLRANGDPRNGGIDWVDWIEQIPIYETRNYVQRVLENAVVYEAMHPEKARYKGPNPLSHFLGKYRPG